MSDGAGSLESASGEASQLASVSMRELAFVFFKWKTVIILVVLFGFIGSLAYIMVIRGDLYQTTAKLLVKIGQEQAPPSTLLGERPVTFGQRPADVNSEIDILMSTELIAQLVDTMGLDRPEPDKPAPEGFFKALKFHAKRLVKTVSKEAGDALISIGLKERRDPREIAIATIGKSLSVKTAPDSNVIEIALRSPVRENASTVLNTLLKLYQEFRYRVFNDPRGVEYFRAQVKESLNALALAQDRLHAFENRHRITELQRQQESVLAQLAKSRALLMNSELEMREAQSKLERVEGELRKGNPDLSVAGRFVSNSFPTWALTELGALNKKKAELAITNQVTGIQMRTVQNQIDKLGELLASNLRATYRERLDAFNTVKREYDGMNSELAELHDAEFEWTNLSREVRTAEETYNFYRKRLEEADAIAMQVQKRIANVVVIQQAMDPIEPFGVRKSLLLTIAGVLSIFAAVALAGVLEFFDHRLFGQDEVRRHVRVPIIAVIPDLGDKNYRA